MKRRLGVSPSEEIKWNRSGLDRETRYAISDGVLGLSKSWTALVLLVEETDKQVAAQRMYDQILDFCHAAAINTFHLDYDEDLVPEMKALWHYLQGCETAVSCLGLQAVDSEREPLIQCADILAGLFRTAVVHELEGRSTRIPVKDFYDDETVACSMSEYLQLFTKHLMPGEQYIEEPEYLPFTDCWDRGFRVASSISDEAKALLRRRIALYYLGCMH